MDDTTQPVAQDASMQTPITDTTAMPNLSDLAGMTPPPPAPVPPVADMTQTVVAGDMQPQPMVDAGVTAGQDLTKDDYSYAEDILDEILDSLDRIEAKVEAIEKKLG